jgi:hypothetical protein
MCNRCRSEYSLSRGSVIRIPSFDLKTTDFRIRVAQRRAVQEYSGCVQCSKLGQRLEIYWRRAILPAEGTIFCIPLDDHANSIRAQIGLMDIYCSGRWRCREEVVREYKAFLWLFSLRWRVCVKQGWKRRQYRAPVAIFVNVMYWRCTMLLMWIVGESWHGGWIE